MSPPPSGTCACASATSRACGRRVSTRVAKKAWLDWGRVNSAATRLSSACCSSASTLRARRHRAVRFSLIESLDRQRCHILAEHEATHRNSSLRLISQKYNLYLTHERTPVIITPPSSETQRCRLLREKLDLLSGHGVDEVPNGVEERGHHLARQAGAGCLRQPLTLSHVWEDSSVKDIGGRGISKSEMEALWPCLASQSEDTALGHFLVMPRAHDPERSDG